MNVDEILQLLPPTKDPKPADAGLERRNGERPDRREMTASKKVDDISRHESRHDMAPKHDPKLNPKPNAREKKTDGITPGSGQPLGGKPPPEKP